MKKILLLTAIAGFLIIGCTKKDTLPTYTPASIFSVTSKMSHTKDSVNLGDTIYLTAKGLIADTTNAFSASFKTFSGSVSSAGAFTSSNIQVGGALLKPTTKIISAPTGTSPLYNWTATYIILVPSVAHKTSILITGYFENSLTLSSQTGNQVASDSKAIYIR